MNEEQIKQYYKRIEKLLNGANKETYGFAPEEIRQILKHYEVLQQENKILKENAEHNDKVVDKVNWENRLLKDRIDKAMDILIKVVG